MSPHFPLADQLQASTHRVENQPPPLENYNSYTADQALQEGVNREGGTNDSALRAFGQWAGSSEAIALGFDANRFAPQLMTHDRQGHRVDLIEFHPAYHQLMQTAVEHGLHASPWRNSGPGAHVTRAANYYLHTQVEAAHGCPITMTFAALPALRHQPSLLESWGDKITAPHYDPRNVPYFEKQGVTLGMAMTEKQGGSDVRINTTRAYPIDQGGPGEAYELVGHKWFVSAPMCDAFLVLAQAPGGLSCFLLPRWRPDGSKNPLHIQQLKRKMGNVANASSETELRGAFAWMVGDEGRGVRTIIEMVAMTRYDCMIGSAAGMRQATAQAIHHASHRQAFGAYLSKQPLMQNVLADLAIESEAATTLMLRMARAMDHQDNEHERLLARIATPVGKYWICKRTPHHAYEAMEVIGGSGVMETHMMPRLFRESPINAIWEGSGNVQCLDILRAIEKQPEVLDAYFAELAKAQGADAHLDRFIHQLQRSMQDTQALQYRARQLADGMALAIQGALLVQHAPAFVADAFCAGRLTERSGLSTGTLPTGLDCAAIIERAQPLE
ncbi:MULTISPECIES: isovaleryl-CoA dehydrogenase [unclassified Halomonas]|uniref:isovaleryl-CoA dehydrogenase n=1 Tax=unclassified Halomonas TaxID=2609666 RepID=UPI0006DB5EAA|nr:MULTISPECIES: isovaleryl-CoA dehydrogenase [unclassified Halomonas]KPQ21544.1 MAG: putative acyl-CoA dehydrogenase [Halomonas sp. HL-93]SBR45630.1 putative acyl-CoA dehydrogenase [Halomonas sp. HL-93]SNY98376.1 putative acyl-CoA dehydrogenase [Halomonas sp. hl-4]